MMNEIRTDKEYRFEMAQLIRDELMIYINDGAKHWLNRSEPDLDMWDMIITDAEDLRLVHTRIDRDEIPFAFNKACDLDTAVRDVIPTKVWNWMSKVHANQKDTEADQKYTEADEGDQLAGQPDIPWYNGDL